MENITSRKNPYIRHLRQLASDADYRRQKREYICDGEKTLREALRFGDVASILWRDTPGTADCCLQYTAPAELFDYASPLKNSAGPVFTVAMPQRDRAEVKRAIVLEGVQDPGNVGTVIRTANAFGIDAVVLTGGCADLYNPKTVRATMGAVFRQLVLETDSPYLAPKPNRGKRNSSLNLPYVVETIAAIKGVTGEEVEQITWENANRFYRIREQ